MTDPMTLSPATAVLVRDACLCLHLQRAARAVARRYDEALRPVGLTNGQFSLLMMLVVPAPPTMGALAAALAMDRTTLTAALKPLIKRGLVAVEPDEDDRRNRRPRLTETGQDLLKQAHPLWQDAQAAVAVLRNPVALGEMKKGLRALSQW